MILGYKIASYDISYDSVKVIHLISFLINIEGSLNFLYTFYIFLEQNSNKLKF